MLDRSFIEKLEELVHQSDSIVRAPDYNETGRYYVRQADGTLEEDQAPVVTEEARLFDTDSLAQLCHEEIRDDNKVRVYYSSKRIVALVFDTLHELYRDHEIVLARHPSFLRLERLTNTEQFTQKSLIRLLRAEFNGHVDDAVIERFRTLKLTTEGGGQSVVAQGRAAVDKSIRQQVQDERGQEIPTEIEITLPVFDLDECREDLMEVGVLVDVTPDDEGRAVFELTAVVNDLRGAERQALDSLVNLLRPNLPEGVRLLYGSV